MIEVAMISPPRRRLDEVLRLQLLTSRCSTGAVEKAPVPVASRKAAPGDQLYVAQQVRLKAPVMVASRKYAPGDLPKKAAMPRR